MKIIMGYDIVCPWSVSWNYLTPILIWITSQEEQDSICEQNLER